MSNKNIIFKILIMLSINLLNSVSCKNFGLKESSFVKRVSVSIDYKLSYLQNLNFKT